MLYECGFARAGTADDCDEFAFFYSEGDIVEGSFFVRAAFHICIAEIPDVYGQGLSPPLVSATAHAPMPKPHAANAFEQLSVSSSPAGIVKPSSVSS